MQRGSLRAPRTPTDAAIEQAAPPSTSPRSAAGADVPSGLDPFLDIMQAASLLSELPPIGPVRHEGDGDIDCQRLDMLVHYYSADDNSEVAERRRLEDGFFLYQEGDPTNAHGIIAGLTHAFTDVSGVKLERLRPNDLDLVLKHGDFMSAVVDEADEDPDTGEIDLRELEEGVSTVSVYSLARALNRLLARLGSRPRVVPLRGDGRREAYVSLSITDALALAKEGLLEIEGVEEVMDFGAW